ncbi:hypothetical protein [Methanosarcina acetivorans]|uniref:Uncharacterized protein n=1 Tax=Methanosarcina acetivorans (strain ATCC 35395 / DSM 2834 / JCM 12185 / C2A) TaxID=188937 RepID=Q8TMR3_METAC|nr:hypothetical protein [Methanosarcina acetivorans]AAM05971.1 predicted protein [Methanosarcina acetivorans C2A]
MAAYNWIVILLCMGFFGLLYACTYDVVAALYASAYTGTDDAALAVRILWTCWKYSPLGCLGACCLYGYLNSQKQGSGF